MKRWSLVAVWALVAVLATGLTWQIVSAADARVSDRPVPLQVDAPLAGASGTTTSTDAIPTTPTAPNTPTQSGTESTVTTTASTTSSTSSATTASSTGSGAWTTKAIPTGGGTVVINYRGDEVVLNAATPAAGFAVEVDKSGPDQVVVEFESESAKYEVKARSSGGVLKVETDSDTD